MNSDAILTSFIQLMLNLKPDQMNPSTPTRSPAIHQASLTWFTQTSSETQNVKVNFWLVHFWPASMTKSSNIN